MIFLKYLISYTKDSCKKHIRFSLKSYFFPEKLETGKKHSSLQFDIVVLT